MVDEVVRSGFGGNPEPPQENVVENNDNVVTENNDEDN